MRASAFIMNSFQAGDWFRTLPGGGDSLVFTGDLELRRVGREEESSGYIREFLTISHDSPLGLGGQGTGYVGRNGDKEERRQGNPTALMSSGRRPIRVTTPGFSGATSPGQ